MDLVLLYAQEFKDVPWNTFFNYGVLGIVVVLLMIGYLYPKPMIDYLRRENGRLQGDNEKLRDENRELRTRIEERVVPALERVTTVLDKMATGGM